MIGTLYLDRWQLNFNLLAITLLLLLSFPSQAISSKADTLGGEIKIIDDRGVEITLSHEAKRVICLYGAFNEIIYALRKSDVLIARTKADKTPESILALPQIGTHMRPNVEMIISLMPDIVFQSTGRKAALEPVKAIERLGIKVAVFNPNSLKGLYRTIMRIGTVIGAKNRAVQLITSMREDIKKISDIKTGKHRTTEDKAAPKVFFEVRYPNLLGAGGKNIVDEVIRLSGGENCFSNIAKKFVRPQFEMLLACNPDVYIIQKGPMNKRPIPPVKRPNYTMLKAIREKAVFYVEESLFSRPTPNIVKAIRILRNIIENHKKTGYRTY